MVKALMNYKLDVISGVYVGSLIPLVLSGALILTAVGPGWQPFITPFGND